VDFLIALLLLYHLFISYHTSWTLHYVISDIQDPELASDQY